MNHYCDLSANERHLARGLLELMDVEDQVHHFQRAMTDSDFDAWEERAQSHRLIGCFAHKRLIGVAEIALNGDDAECSLYVAVEHRRKGIGTVLFERARAAVRESGGEHLAVLVTRGDGAMAGLRA